MAGTTPSCAAMKDPRGMDGQAPTRDEEAGRGKRMGVEKIVPHSFVRRKEASRLQQRRTHGGSTDCITASHRRKSDTRSQKGAKTSKKDWKR